MTEHTIAVSRTARYYTAGAVGPHLDEVWFGCHGYGQLVQDFLSYLEPLNDGNRYIVAPEALSRFYREGVSGTVGASWMTREFRDAEIADYVAYLDRVYERVFSEIDRSAVTFHVLGFSQGVAAACRWIARGNSPIDHVVMWAGQLPPEFADPGDVQELRASRISVVWGTQDETLSGETMRNHGERLRSLGLSFAEIVFEGGHRLDRQTLLNVSRRTR